MNSRTLILLALLLGVAALVVAACAAPAATSTPTPVAAPTKAPAAATAPAATAAPSTSGATGSAERGKTVFEANCNGCHPGGNKGAGPDIRGKSEDVVKTKVRAGGGGMPPFSASQINDQQLNDVAAYVNSLK